MKPFPLGSSPFLQLQAVGLWDVSRCPRQAHRHLRQRVCLPLGPSQTLSDQRRHDPQHRPADRIFLRIPLRRLRRTRCGQMGREKAPLPPPEGDLRSLPGVRARSETRGGCLPAEPRSGGNRNGLPSTRSSRIEDCRFRTVCGSNPKNHRLKYDLLIASANGRLCFFGKVDLRPSPIICRN